MGQTQSALEANLLNCGASSVIRGANFNRTNSLGGETTVIQNHLSTSKCHILRQIKEKLQ